MKFIWQRCLETLIVIEIHSYRHVRISQIFVGWISPATLKLHISLSLSLFSLYFSLVRTSLTQISSRINMHSKCMDKNSQLRRINTTYVYGTLWICWMEIRLQFRPDETKLNDWPQRQHSWNITISEFIVRLVYLKWSKLYIWHRKMWKVREGDGERIQTYVTFQHSNSL